MNALRMIDVILYPINFKIIVQYFPRIMDDRGFNDPLPMGLLCNISKILVIKRKIIDDVCEI